MYSKVLKNVVNRVVTSTKAFNTFSFQFNLYVDQYNIVNCSIYSCVAVYFLSLKKV